MDAQACGARFYGLSEPLIRRFYAGAPTLYDRLRIVTGRPPVPFGRAVRVAFGPAQPVPSPEESR